MAADRVRAAGSGRGRVARILCAVVPALVICAGLAVSGLPTLGSTYAALSLTLEDHLRTRPAAVPARVALGPRGRDIRLAGEIGEGTAERLRALLAAHPNVVRIHLTSEGGLVEEAMAIGDLIAARGLSTYVPDYCVSACTLAFVRGPMRYLVTNGRLGFHAPYDPGLFGQVVQADGAPERAAYVAAGVDPAFADEAVGTASDSLWIPQAARLVEARVVTDLVETGHFPDSTLDDDPSPAGARAAILRALPLLDSLDGRDEILTAMAAAYLDGYRAGVTEAEALDRLRARARVEVGRVLRGADDATWVEIGRILLRGMRRADPEACRAIGGEGDLLTAQDVLGGEVLDGAAPGDGAVRALLARAVERRVSGAAPPPVLVRPPRDCSGLIAAYTRALAAPGAGATLRALAGHGRPPAREASALPR